MANNRIELWRKLLIAQSGLLLLIGASGCQEVIYDDRDIEELPSLNTHTTETFNEDININSETTVPSGESIADPELPEVQVIPQEEIETPQVNSGKKVYPQFVMTEGNATKYTVVKNDSLWKIAIKYGITAEELADYNKITPAKGLHVGQTLMIPPGGKLRSQADMQKEIDRQRSMVRKHSSSKNTSISNGSSRNSKSTSNAGTTKSIAESSRPADGFHIVQAGDFPAKIAKKYGITVNELMSANNLSNSRGLQIGQRLLIPEISGGKSVAVNVTEKAKDTGSSVKGVNVVSTQSKEEVDIEAMMNSLNSTEKVDVAPPVSKDNKMDDVIVDNGANAVALKVTTMKVPSDISVKDFALKIGITEAEFCTQNPAYMTEKIIKANSVVMVPSDK